MRGLLLCPQRQLNLAQDQIRRFSMKIIRILSTVISLSLLLAALTLSSAQTQPGNITLQRERTASPEIQKTLTELRRKIQTDKLTFEVGYTTALDRRIEQLAGTRAPANLPAMAQRQNSLALKLTEVDDSA